MSRSSAIRDAWHPQTAEDRQAVLAELQEVLASPPFCNSKRYPALLEYIVQNTLDGKSDQLKERTIGVEVFDRPSSYDTSTDTVVRYTAGEVRKRLALYYHELDRKPLIQILLPAGSYIPEFIHAQDEPDHDTRITHVEWLRDHETAPHAAAASYSDLELHADRHPGVETPPSMGAHAQSPSKGVRWRRTLLLVGGTALILFLVLMAVRRLEGSRSSSTMQEFWAPLLHDQRTVLVCSGGVVFKPTNFSGVETAGKDIDYPFVSSQIATSIARVSGLLARNGASMDLQFSASTPLTVLREQPLVLLGGYNNQWTMRLLNPMPYHFEQETPGSSAEIVSATQPNVRWMRDPSVPYASADDYALVARFKDTTTDSWVLVIAGLGRNGTEAAALFVTTPHYMDLLRSQVGSAFSNRNIEAVLKVNVVDGKTGAPSILAVHAW
jgi:hypothetical protein